MFPFSYKNIRFKKRKNHLISKQRNINVVLNNIKPKNKIVQVKVENVNLDSNGYTVLDKVNIVKDKQVVEVNEVVEDKQVVEDNEVVEDKQVVQDKVNEYFIDKQKSFNNLNKDQTNIQKGLSSLNKLSKKYNNKKA